MPVAERGIHRRVLLAIRCAVAVPVPVHARLPEKIVRECPVQFRDLAPHLFMDVLCKPGVPTVTVLVLGGGVREVGRAYGVIGTDLGPAASIFIQPPVFGVELIPKGLQSRVGVVDRLLNDVIKDHDVGVLGLDRLDRIAHRCDRSPVREEIDKDVIQLRKLGLHGSVFVSVRSADLRAAKAREGGFYGVGQRVRLP